MAKKAFIKFKGKSDNGHILLEMYGHIFEYVHRKGPKVLVKSLKTKVDNGEHVAHFTGWIEVGKDVDLHT